MADQLRDGDTVKFSALSQYGGGIAVKISRWTGPRVTVTSFGSGKEVYESPFGQEIQVSNPSALPIDVQIRAGFLPPPPPGPGRGW